MSSVNPNRQRLMSPLDYLAALSGYQPPQPMMPGPVYDVPFQVQDGPGLPMPFVEQLQPNPYLPALAEGPYSPQGW